MSGWVTVYDVASQPFRWGNAGEGLAALAMVCLGAAGAALARRRSVSLSAAAVGVGVFLAALFVNRTIDHRRQHTACVEAARHGDGTVLEGAIRDFHPLTSVWQRPGNETFTVAGQTVSYPLLAEGCGYHQVSIEGGPIRDGLKVRVLVWNGQILKLEIDRDQLLVPEHSHPPL